MVTKAAKARRKENRGQRKQEKVSSTKDVLGDGHALEGVREEVDPPEGSTCTHFGGVLPKALQSAIADSLSLFCQVCRVCLLKAELTKSRLATQPHSRSLVGRERKFAR